MSVRMRHTRAHTGNRRAHHALALPRMSRCANCGAFHLRHRSCAQCGHYRGTMVIDVSARLAKKEKREKTRSRAR